MHPEPPFDHHPMYTYLKLIILVLICALFSSTPAQGGQVQFEIKLATLAPENSSLMKIFQDMNSELQKETDGRVGLQLFSGFVLGEERDIFRKLRIGLLHAATFTSTFLVNMNPDIRAIQVPFLFNNYEEVDYVLEKMADEFNKMLAKKGYQILGWTEVGFIYVMTTVAIKTVEDLKGKKVWTSADSSMANAVFEEAQTSPVTIAASDILVALQTDLVEIVFNSPYYALVTQWYTRIQYIIDVPLAYIGGALIIDNKVFSRLSPRDQETTKRVSAKYVRRLTLRTRKDNQEALEVMLKRNVKKIQLQPAELERFKQLLNEAIRDLDPAVLPRDAFRKVQTTLEHYRATREDRS
jgi:TRAP-type C4-dicarboxylate transport system substrate-binding protein